MDTQEHVESKTYQLGTERKSTPLASRISDYAVQCQHSHTKSGEVCLEVKQRALPLSFMIARNIKPLILPSHASSYMKSICMVDGSTR